MKYPKGRQVSFIVRFTSGCETIMSGTGKVVSDTRKYTFQTVKGLDYGYVVNNVKRRAKKHGYTGWRIYENKEMDQQELINDMKYLPQ